MRKGILLFLSLLCIAGTMGCGAKKNEKQEVTYSSKQESVTEATSQDDPEEEGRGSFIAEDAIQGNSSVIKIGNRYVYYSPEKKGICYTDKVTGEEAYLCNKAECSHDGKETCVATDKRYEIQELRLYNGKVFANIVEETAAKYLFKLLVIEPDGSEVQELVTYLETEKAGRVPVQSESFQIHRNKAILPVEIKGTGGEAEYGLAIVDLNTRVVTYPDIEPLSVNNPKTGDIKGYRDYLFYCRPVGKRTLLYRYRITDGQTDTHEMLPSFGGVYGLLDENRVLYLMCKENGKRKGYEFCVHYLSSGKNEVVKQLTRTYSMGWNSMIEGKPREIVYPAEWMTLDDTYIYVAESATIGTMDDIVLFTSKEVIQMNVHVYDRNLSMVATVDFGTVLENIIPKIGQYKEAVARNHCNLSFFEEEVYCTITLPEGDVVCKCSREEFLTGKPEFELVIKEQP